MAVELLVSAGANLDYRSADTSFRTPLDIARYLVHEHGSHASFAQVIRATNQVYPGFLAAVTRARRYR